MKQKKSRMQTYFAHRTPVVEIICYVGFALCVVAAIFLPGGIPIGMSVATVLAVVLIFTSAARVKDAEVDATVEALFAARGISPDPATTLTCYDLAERPVVKGRDGKLRSPVYVLSRYDTFDDELRIMTYRVDILAEDIQKDIYHLSTDIAISLAEESVMTPNGPRTRYTLTSDMFPAIPVPAGDYEAAEFIKKICR